VYRVEEADTEGRVEGEAFSRTGCKNLVCLCFDAPFFGLVAFQWKVGNKQQDEYTNTFGTNVVKQRRTKITLPCIVPNFINGKFSHCSTRH
jgi:hypothetical protein